MTPGQDGAEDAGPKTLEEVRYVIGDFISVAVFINGAPGNVARNYEGPRGHEGPRAGSYSRGGGPGERGKGRVDSYRGGSGRGRVGRNGFDSRPGDRDDRAPPGGPRGDRDRDPDRSGRW